jgi:hypothetical protein
MATWTCSWQSAFEQITTIAGDSVTAPIDVGKLLLSMNQISRRRLRSQY